jgi:hypothetical protein
VIEEESEKAAITTFPNPTTGHLFIKSSVAVSQYEIFNEVGQLIEGGELMTNTGEFSLIVPGNTGMYVVRLFTMEGLPLPPQKVIKVD